MRPYGLMECGLAQMRAWLNTYRFSDECFARLNALDLSGAALKFGHEANSGGRHWACKSTLRRSPVSLSVRRIGVT